jgi:hypothetical protein
MPHSKDHRYMQIIKLLYKSQRDSEAIHRELLKRPV